MGTSSRLWLKGAMLWTLAMLAVGVGRAIAADAWVTAINIPLEPDAKPLQQAAATNERLRRAFPSGPTLSSGEVGLID